MIEVHNVSKSHGRRVALSGVSLHIHPGQVTLLLGANGAGKSTLLRALLGIIDYEGRIRVAGLDPLRDGPKVRALIGYMPQSGGLHQDLTVIGTLRLFAAIRQAPPDRCMQLLAEAGLSEHRDVRVGELSGGMRQRLGFAVALLTDPPILVLDEPSASLDARSREWLSHRLHLAAADGRVVLISTHADHEMLSAGDRRLILEDGQLVSSDGGETDVATTTKTAATGKVAPLMQKELADAVGNKWLIGYAFLLGVLGLAAAVTGMEETAGFALQAFGRTTATLMNLCLLLAPLVAVLMGSAAIAGERERGTLEHLLAQPLSRTRLLLAKYAALVFSLVTATVVGFLPAGLLIVSAAGPGVLWQYLLFPLIASVVGIAMAGLGIAISVASRTAVQAQGVAVFAWFGFVLLYDLLLVAMLAASGLPVQLLAAALVANPVDAARVLGTLALEPDLYLLGPAGAYLTATLSRTGTALLLSAALIAWTVGPVMLAVARFRLPTARQISLRRRPVVAEQTPSRTATKEIAAILLAIAGLGVTIACSSQANESATTALATNRSAPSATGVDLSRGRDLYKTNCTPCHGETGRGDGPAAGVLKPAPRDHTDRAYMSTLTNEDLAKVIQIGGAIKNKPLMPGNPQIRGADLDALVAYVRSLSAATK